MGYRVPVKGIATQFHVQPLTQLLRNQKRGDNDCVAIAVAAMT